ncbi:GSCFA domain-containing protein [Stagnihabitans tardus]|uniref:GSCFA family protein n=1 Tax=Stagnihabitans tardus TaxID=2699202 RepID=A0AAE4Y7N1_9RHOB|nr:GSCFA domain-containing protein [Stagnihabitans tardus]NBZ87417.1 GSCFA family protein [Stagnihabitans tardus]
MEKISPYQGLEPRAFWRTGYQEGDYPPADLYRPKWALSKTDRIVTAGSCFAQHVGRALRKNGFTVLDAEPAPEGLAPERHGENGYGMYSARYGNIYTTRQLRQLMEEAWDGPRDFDAIWTKGGRFHDAMRPNVDPQGLDSAEAVKAARVKHLAAVKEVFSQADVFIFTLGLTEAWMHKPSGQVYAIAPGTVAGVYDPSVHGFVNFRAAEVRADLVAALARLKETNPKLRVLLTVSPVPLTATASGGHILAATTWSKSVLRAVAGELYEDFPEVDYFPSYEIVTSTRAGISFFEPNFRQVTEAGVARVMQVFTAAHLGAAAPETETEEKTRKRSEEERQARKAERQKAKKG